MDNVTVYEQPDGVIDSSNSSGHWQQKNNVSGMGARSHGRTTTVDDDYDTRNEDDDDNKKREDTRHNASHHE